MCHKLKEKNIKKMSLTHFIMIFQKFKCPKHKYIGTKSRFCIHMINNVYRKAIKCLKLDLTQTSNIENQAQMTPKICDLNLYINTYQRLIVAGAVLKTDLLLINGCSSSKICEPHQQCLNKQSQTANIYRDCFPHFTITF